MNIIYFLISLLSIFASQALCNAKANPNYGTGSSDTPYNSFLDHYSSLLDNGDLLYPKKSSILDQPSVFDTDPFFTKPLFPKSTSLSYDLSSSPFSDFDSKFGKISFDSSEPKFDSSDSDEDEYTRKTKKTSSKKYNSESSSKSSTIHVGMVYPGSSGSLNSVPSVNFHTFTSSYGSSSPSSYGSSSPSSYESSSPSSYGSSSPSSYGSSSPSSYGSSSPSSSHTSQPPLSNVNSGHSDEDSSDSDRHEKKYKKPSSALDGAAAFTTGAAAGAVVVSALKNKPSQNQKPPLPIAATPYNQNSQQSRNNEDKCNWCIRPHCNPGGCQDAPNFDPKKDAEALHKAVKGIGTDERVLIDILTHRSDKQIKKIRQEYQELAKGLDSDIADDTSFKTKALLMALLQPRALFFAEELHKAFKNNDNSAMIMILTSLSPCAVKRVGAAYILKYEKALADDIRGASVQNFENFLVELSRGNRKRDGPVNVEQAKKDAQALYSAGPKKWFVSDKTVFIDIFTHRSYTQLRQIIKEYDEMRKPQKSNLRKDIDDNTSDKLEKGLMAMMRNVEDQPGYFADELEGSLDKLIGSGIRDNEKLIRIMRGRCGIDLGDIRDAYPKNHNGKKLADRLAKKTFMDYEEALLAMLQQPQTENQSQKPNN